MGSLTVLLFILLLLLGSKGIKLDREYQRGVIFRLGRLKAVMGPGINWIVPFVDQKVQLDVRTKTVSIEAQ
jgi:regulator of protease activity HflC (stomatin/prohibitin superfamily)